MTTCVDAVREAVTELGGVVSTREVIDYIYRKYPNRPWKESSIRAHLIGLSVNHPTSRHYPALRKHAFLFCVDRGKYRLYNPEKDGKWIVDNRGVHQLGEEPSESIDESDETETFEERYQASISLERDLHEYIFQNLDSLEEGLRPYEGIRGNEYSIDVGRIDILAVDKNNDLVVIEIKTGIAKDKVIGQVMRYIGFIKENVAEKTQKVRGIIIADDFDENLKYVKSVFPDLELKCYKVSFRFEEKKFS